MEYARLRSLVERLVMSGSKAEHVSASECHEIHDDVVELLATLATMHSDAHLAREAMAAVQEDLRKAEKRIAEAVETANDFNQQRIAATRMWELATERSAEFKSRLEAALADASRLRTENEQLKRDRADAMTDLVTRDRMIERLQKERDEKLWSCPDCAFTFAAYHTNADGKLTCPNCENEAMREVYNEALLWRRELIGERTSYDLRLEAAINTALASKNGDGE